MDQNNGSGTQNSNGFSKEYVEELRAENASWRKKLREAENIIGQYENAAKEVEMNDKIQEELRNKGVEGVEPHWVDVDDNQSPSEAVDTFLKNHPQFVKSDDDAIGAPSNQNADGDPRKSGSHNIQSRTPTPIPTNRANTNQHMPQNPEIGDIKKDPRSRAKIRDLYRSLLQQESHGRNTI
jgi:hypothetical protein